MWFQASPADKETTVCLVSLTGVFLPPCLFALFLHIYTHMPSLPGSSSQVLESLPSSTPGPSYMLSVLHGMFSLEESLSPHMWQRHRGTCPGESPSHRTLGLLCVWCDNSTLGPR
jgi:hypothetical protein